MKRISGGKSDLPTTTEEPEPTMSDDFFSRKEATEEDYEVFGLTSSASMDEVTEKYRALSKKNHPDTVDGSAFIFKQIEIAYERIQTNRTIGRLV